jgi:hypothetical protein
MRSDKGHRNRKNPGSAEFFKKLRKEQNAARPKQEIVTVIEHSVNGGKSDVVRHLRVRG